MKRKRNFCLYSIIVIMVVLVLVSTSSCKILSKLTETEGEMQSTSALILIEGLGDQASFTPALDLLEKLRRYYLCSTDSIILERPGETILIEPYTLARCVGADSSGNIRIVFRDAVDVFLTFSPKSKEEPDKFVLYTLKDIEPQSVQYGEHIFRVVKDKKYSLKNVTIEPGVTPY